MNITKAQISIGTLAAAIPVILGALMWTRGWVNDGHAAVALEAEANDTVLSAVQYAGQVELTLQQINLELKMLRTIQERRALTADEQDRKTYLEALREIIVAEQRKKVA
jgi:hypothetical protein